MAVDLDAIRKKLNQISGGNSRRNVLWRPEVDTETTIRLLAFPDNDGQPFKELWFYYNIGNNPGLLAPYQVGKPDPFQELINKLRDDGANGNKDAYELAKKLYPKMRCYAPVLIRGEESEGVKLWSFGKMVYQNILNIMLDEDYGDITDPLQGRDVKIKCYQKQGTPWKITDVVARPKVTPLSDDPKQAKEWLENIPDPNDIYELKSYEQLEKIINDWLNESDDDDNDGSSRGFAQEDGGDTSVSSAASIDSKIKDLDSAFADLEI